MYNFGNFSIFDLTSLIKLFFREMPDCLLTSVLHPKFLEVVKHDSSKTRLDGVLALCLKLPDLNLHTLIYLMHFLKKITLAESINLMNSFNLATIFAPNICSPKNNSMYIDQERVVVQILIENSSMIGRGNRTLF